MMYLNKKKEAIIWIGQMKHKLPLLNPKKNDIHIFYFKQDIVYITKTIKFYEDPLLAYHLMVLSEDTDTSFVPSEFHATSHTLKTYVSMSHSRIN